MKAILALILLTIASNSAFAGTCKPTGICTACKTCSGCGHCAKGGGTCSVCARNNAAAPTKLKDAKAAPCCPKPATLAKR